MVDAANSLIERLPEQPMSSTSITSSLQRLLKITSTAHLG